MWFIFLLGVCFRLVIADKIILEPGKVHTFTTKGYPNVNYERGEENYEFDSTPGSQIITICTDFRVIEKPNPCESFSMTLKDGQKEKSFCRNGNSVEFRSASSWLKVTIKYKNGGLVSCMLRSTADPPVEEKIIYPNENHVLDFPNKRDPFLDKAWIFKQSNGRKFKLECSATLSGNCNQDIVMYGVGANRKELCRSETFVIEGEEIFLRAVLGINAQGFVRCYAQIDKDHNTNYDKDPSGSSDTQTPSPPPTIFKNNYQINIGEVQNFELGKQHQEIEFSTTNGNSLHLFCEYIFVHDKQNPCDEVLIKMSEGMEYCGETTRYLNYFSKGSSLKLISTFKYERPVICTAVANPKTVDVRLEVSDGIYHFRQEGDHINNYNKGWNFKTRPGTKLSFQCDISFTSYDDQKTCTKAVLRVHDGEKEQNFCGAKKIVLISKQTDLNVIIQVMAGSSGNFFCNVQTITGPNPNQIDNLKIEDSQENAGEGKGRLTTTCACGRRNKNQKKFNGRIINGNSTKEGEYTWIASIRYNKYSQRCGGSIITPYHVLTAAHCMTNSKVRKKYEITTTEVYVGAYKLHEDASHKMTKGYEVERTFIPEEYWDFKKNYDIAVLYLKKKISFNEYVGPVCLSPSPPKLLHKAVNSIGWGMTENNGPAPELLQTKLFIGDKSDCGNVDYIICTYNKHSSTCYGDSGGPLSYLDEDTNLYTQVGVVSYGTAKDCRKGSGFSNITYHWKFIMDAIKETNPSANICQKLN